MDQGLSVPPMSALGDNRTIFTLIGANMNTTADQAFSKSFPFTTFILDTIIVTNASGAILLAAGGIYTAPAKGGTAIVAAAQVYTGLTSTTKVINPTIASAGTDLRSDSTLYLSLTTAMGSAATADIYVVGIAG